MNREDFDNTPRALHVCPDVIGLNRFARTVRNIFFPAWRGFDSWRLKSDASDVTWRVCCDYRNSTMTFADLVFPDRDAFRAFLILTGAVAQSSDRSIESVRQRLVTVRDMASFIRRDRIAEYIDDVVSGLSNGDVTIEHGSVTWIFTSLEWIQPATQIEDGENDALFEDSLLFTEIKRRLEKEEQEVA